MGLEVGSIVEGKVTGITNFGAFVDLADGKTGMVHISEVAPTYVNQIKDHLTEGQTVKVKILSVSDDGKISLSIKKAMENYPNKDTNGEKGSFSKGNGRAFRKRNDRPKAPPVTSPGNFEWQSSRKTNDASSFEDMMSRFKQTSEEKISDLKRGFDTPNRRPRKNQK